MVAMAVARDIKNIRSRAGGHSDKSGAEAGRPRYLRGHERQADPSPSASARGASPVRRSAGVSRPIEGGCGLSVGPECSGLASRRQARSTNRGGNRTALEPVFALIRISQESFCAPP